MQASMGYKSVDSTEYINKITQDVLPAGVYLFPGDEANNQWILPGTGKQVIVKGPWVVRNSDGMTIRELAGIEHKVSVPDLGEYYVGLFSRYLIDSDPLLELKAVTTSEYNNWAEKKHFVTFARLNVTDSQISIQMIDLKARTIPNGIFALAEDLVKTGSIVRSVVNVVGLKQTLEDPKVDEIVYVVQENALYRYMGNGNWIRIDCPSVGIANFNSILGTQINLDPIFRNKPYVVNICPSEPGNGCIGEWWVEYSPNSFKVFNTGSAKTAFCWHVLSRVQ